MKIVAGLIAHNECDRYLDYCVEALLEWCDHVRILDDGSDDRLADSDYFHRPYSGVYVKHQERGFYSHEGNARQRLLEWTMLSEPTHIVAIDADEFIENGPELRKLIEDNAPQAVYNLCMQEVWKAGEGLSIRMDGGWIPHEVAIVWDPKLVKDHRFRNVALASGRVPQSVNHLIGRRGAASTGQSILHFGWANQNDRAARHARYVEHDGGNFHASAHLNSIMFPDERVTLCHQEWPEGMVNVMDAVRARANR